MNDRASPASGAEDPGLDHSDGALDSHSIPPSAYYSKPSDHCMDPTSSRAEARHKCEPYAPEPKSGQPRGGGGLMRWGALGSALRSLEDEAKRTG